MTFSSELKRKIRELHDKHNPPEATSEDLEKVLKPIIPKEPPKESDFMRKMREALEKPSSETVPKKEQPTQKKPVKKRELSVLDQVSVWFTTKIEAVRAQLNGLLERLEKGHGSGVDADLLDGAHADELVVRAAEVAGQRRGGGSMFGITDHGQLSGLGDDDHAQYVPVDGLARQLANAGYPNALLLDGSRPMNFGHSTLEFTEVLFDARYYPEIVPVMTLGNMMFMRTILSMYEPTYDSPGLYLYKTTGGVPDKTKVGVVLYNQAMFGGLYFKTVGEGDIIFDPFGVIQAKKDVVMTDDKMIDLGNDTAGAAANAANRGKLRFVEGAGGARDRVYSCMKSDGDAYNWIQIADGGA